MWRSVRGLRTASTGAFGGPDLRRYFTMHPSTLTLDLQGYPSCDSEGYPSSSQRHYTLSWVDLGDSDIGDLSLVSGQDALRFTSSSPVHISYAHVFLGRLSSGDLEHPSQIICKFIENNVPRVQNEAELYATALKSARGSLVPKFYGYFAGRSSHGTVACILLQYGGVSLAKDPRICIPIEMRKKITDEFMILHWLGVYHSHFACTNVVMDETGHLRIIDFDDAFLHECRVEKREYPLLQLQPTWAEMPCQELQEVTKTMGIWTPRCAWFDGIDIDMHPLPSVDDVVREAQARKPYSKQTPESWRLKAQRFLIAYQETCKERHRVLEEGDAEKATTAAKTDDALVGERSSVMTQLGRLSIRDSSTVSLE